MQWRSRKLLKPEAGTHVDSPILGDNEEAPAAGIVAIGIIILGLVLCAFDIRRKRSHS